MPHVSSSSVQVEAWVEVGAQTEITYRVYPESDIIEISVGGSHELELLTSERPAYATASRRSPAPSKPSRPHLTRIDTVISGWR